MTTKKVTHLHFTHPGAAAPSSRCEGLEARCNRLPQRRWGTDDLPARPYAGITTTDPTAVTCKRCLAWMESDAVRARHRAEMNARVGGAS